MHFVTKMSQSIDSFEFIEMHSFVFLKVSTFNEKSKSDSFSIHIGVDASNGLRNFVECDINHIE